MSWTVTGPIWIGKAVMRVERQARKPASCRYRNKFPNHEELVVPIYGVLSRRFLTQTVIVVWDKTWCGFLLLENLTLFFCTKNCRFETFSDAVGIPLS